MDDSLFEDKPFEESPKAEVASAKDDALFDDTLFEDKPHPDIKAKTDVSKSRAALVGAGQGASLGWGSKLTAPIMAAAEMSDAPTLQNEQPDHPESLKSRMIAQLAKFQRLKEMAGNTLNEEQKQAQEQHPGYYTAGAMGGSILPTALLPMAKAGNIIKGAATGAAAGAGGGSLGTLASTAVKAAGGAGIGAGLGAVQGAGEAPAGQELEGAEQGGKVGAGIGGALSVAGQVIKSGSKLVGQGLQSASKIPIVERTIENFKQGLEGNDLTSSEGRRKVADTLRNIAGQVSDKLQNLRSNTGKQIGAAVNESTAAGKTIDVTDEVNAVLKNLDEVNDSTSNTIKKQITKKLGINPDAEKTVLPIGGETPDSTSLSSGKKNVSLDALDEVIEQKVKQNMPTNEIEGSTKDLSTEINPEQPEEDIAFSKSNRIVVTPDKAKELRDILNNYSVKKGIVASEIPSRQQATDLYNKLGSKMQETVPGLADTDTEVGLNTKYGTAKDTLTRMGLNPKKLPQQLQDQVFTTLSNLEKETTAGDQARAKVQDVINNVTKIDPDEGQKLKTLIDQGVKPYDLANRNLAGPESHGFIKSTLALAPTSANIAGRAVKAVGGSAIINAAKAAPEAISEAIPQPVKSFTQEILNPSTSKAAVTVGAVESQGAKVASQTPFKLQRQVADATSTADPETIKQQAQNIRKQNGKQGEQLAQQLENLANEPKADKRQSLMFMIMQSPVNRKMMGLMSKEK